MMSLRTVTRVVLVLAAAVVIVAAATWPVMSVAWAAAAGVSLLFCAPVVPIAALRWIRPRTSAMMIATRRRLNRRRGPRVSVTCHWVSGAHIARDLRLAAIAAEDGYFRHHSGFDWHSIRDAHAHNRTHADKRGGSTITQQVAKNLFLWPGRSWGRKVVEAHLTLLIEALWPKRRILEVYLNIAQLGADVFGVEAAARRYFNKPASDLTQVEAALITAALPNPVRYMVDRPSHQMLFRQAWILAAMRRLGDEYLEGL